MNEEKIIQLLEIPETKGLCNQDLDKPASLRSPH